MMGGFIDELFDLLQKEYDILQKMKEYTKVKTDIIIQNDILALNDLLAKEREKSEELKRIDIKQKDLIEKINSAFGVNVKNFSHLRSFLDEEKDRLFFDIINRINILVNEIKSINQLNMSLIQNSLEYIDFISELFTSSLADDVTYQKDGQNNQSQKSLFDVKL